MGVSSPFTVHRARYACVGSVRSPSGPGARKPHIANGVASEVRPSHEGNRHKRTQRSRRDAADKGQFKSQATETQSEETKPLRLMSPGRRMTFCAGSSAKDCNCRQSAQRQSSFTGWAQSVGSWGGNSLRNRRNWCSNK